MNTIRTATNARAPPIHMNVVFMSSCGGASGSVDIGHLHRVFSLREAHETAARSRTTPAGRRVHPQAPTYNFRRNTKVDATDDLPQMSEREPGRERCLLLHLAVFFYLGPGNSSGI